MKAASALAAIAVALALQTTLASFAIRGTAALDLVLIVVVYLALISGPVTGLLLGSAAGLIQDALSSGIIGIGGLAKTIVGFAAGSWARSSSSLRRCRAFVVFVMATVLHATVFMGLYMLLDLRQFDAPYTAVLSQAVGNGFLGVVGAQLVELLPGLRAAPGARRGAPLNWRLRLAEVGSWQLATSGRDVNCDRKAFRHPLGWSREPIAESTGLRITNGHR